MAFVSDTTRLDTGSATSWFGAAVETVKLAIERRRVYQQTYEELSLLTERELADIGLSSLMIRDLAREAAAKV